MKILEKNNEKIHITFLVNELKLSHYYHFEAYVGKSI